MAMYSSTRQCCHGPLVEALQKDVKESIDRDTVPSMFQFLPQPIKGLSVGPKKETPLIYAIRQGKNLVAKSLLEMVDIDEIQPCGEVAMDAALETKDDGLIDQLRALTKDSIHWKDNEFESLMKADTLDATKVAWTTWLQQPVEMTQKRTDSLLDYVTTQFRGPICLAKLCVLFTAGIGVQNTAMTRANRRAVRCANGDAMAWFSLSGCRLPPKAYRKFDISGLERPARQNMRRAILRHPETTQPLDTRGLYTDEFLQKLQAVVDEMNFSEPDRQQWVKKIEKSRHEYSVFERGTHLDDQVVDGPGGARAEVECRRSNRYAKTEKKPTMESGSRRPVNTVDSKTQKKQKREQATQKREEGEGQKRERSR